MSWVTKIFATGVIRWLVGTSLQTGIIVAFVFHFMSISLVSMDGRIGDVSAATLQTATNLQDGLGEIRNGQIEIARVLGGHTERFNSINNEFSSIRREIAVGLNALSVSISRLEPTAAEPLQEWGRTYLASIDQTQVHLVTAGDSLAAISLKYYGTTAETNAIYQANRDILTSPTRLLIGQLLRIP